MNTNTITPYEAIKLMKQYTNRNIPFAFSYASLNTTNSSSKGIIEVDEAVLRKSMVNSLKKDVLIEYTDLAKDKDRHFYFPLLLSFNQYKISPVK